ncbi:sugar ABC transporter permease (plasmid) [Deinococcus metallilatus]|uniref:Multiple sugar transport system permease protein n=1 Tax=Deinococcus metallilatus TaxID=1211322 RepID=A0AAJ5JZL7_9DEIO|nr:sugar ABC transporter permease [Deinococcus metallilatus]MBB5293454.1 multiple sugar transport system permease protein [Deinococcus metallilatus]QBY06540.1 sugar ABC transporter permease [Deinococcus metallilatus]RXJ17883.1 sugar ABC transporter permease [Deinococcus metallilatus]TLK32155.1 sugar ABC transporter permease [Deinococcus metallilatus]GMA15326.1 ABC transporter permease [Deinococcus metallilatus]
MTRLATPPLRSPARPARRERRERWTAALFLAPDVIGLAVFVVLPIVAALVISFTNWNALGSPSWVGAANYQRLLADPVFWSSLRVTALYTVIYVPLVFAVSLGLALLANQRLPLIGAFRTIFFVPVVLSLVVTGLMWRFIFDEQVGLLNYALSLVHLPPRAWLGDVNLALPAIIVVSVWINMGYYMTIFLAGLQDIPREYYEAARIDGAGGWQSFWRITLPLLRPTSLFVLVVTLIGSFQVFDQIWVMTKGGPADATQVTVIYIYKQAFQYLSLGYASAIAFALFLVIFVVSLAQFWLVRKED